MERKEFQFCLNAQFFTLYRCFCLFPNLKQESWRLKHCFKVPVEFHPVLKRKTMKQCFRLWADVSSCGWVGGSVIFLNDFFY